MNRVEIKENAKKSLKGKYKETILMMLIFLGINFAAGFVIEIIGTIFKLNNEVIKMCSDIASFVINGLLMFGYISYFLKISRNEEVTKDELFNKTDLILPYILLTVVVGFFTFLWSLLFIIPGIIAAIKYSMVYYITLDNPQIGIEDAIKKSKEIMNGHKMDYLVLNLSFLGWAILGIFTLGILYFWLVPYITVAEANFYNSIKDKN